MNHLIREIANDIADRNVRFGQGAIDEIHQEAEAYIEHVIRLAVQIANNYGRVNPNDRHPTGPTHSKWRI